MASIDVGSAVAAVEFEASQFEPSRGAFRVLSSPDAVTADRHGSQSRTFFLIALTPGRRIKTTMRRKRAATAAAAGGLLSLPSFLSLLSRLLDPRSPFGDQRGLCLLQIARFEIDRKRSKERARDCVRSRESFRSKERRDRSKAAALPFRLTSHPLFLPPPLNKSKSGTFTNQIQKHFEEPRLLLLTDPRTDHQPIRESGKFFMFCFPSLSLSPPPPTSRKSIFFSTGPRLRLSRRF